MDVLVDASALLQLVEHSDRLSRQHRQILLDPGNRGEAVLVQFGKSEPDHGNIVRTAFAALVEAMPSPGRNVPERPMR